MPDLTPVEREALTLGLIRNMGFSAADAEKIAEGVGRSAEHVCAMRFGVRVSAADERRLSQSLDTIREAELRAQWGTGKPDWSIQIGEASEDRFSASYWCGCADA